MFNEVQGDEAVIYLFIYLSITTKNIAEALVVASKEIGLAVNADKTKYMVMTQEQNQDEVTV